MLYVTFGRDFCKGKYILDTRIYFRQHKRPEWFEDPFVKEFLMKIDGTTVLFEEALKDKFGHGISTEMISTGCKTLCDIYYNTDEDLIFYGTAMGNNCYPFLFQIAENRKVRIFLEHYPDFDNSYFTRGMLISEKTGLPYTEDTFADEFSDWSYWVSYGDTDEGEY